MMIHTCRHYDLTDAGFYGRNQLNYTSYPIQVEDTRQLPRKELHQPANSLHPYPLTQGSGPDPDRSTPSPFIDTTS